MGILLQGLFYTVASTAWVDELRDPRREYSPWVFLFGLLFTIGGYWRFRQTARRWEFELGVVDYERRRIERMLHPVRRMWKGRIRQILLWTPSAVAGFVLFFLPVATHVLHLGSSYLPHYDIPIPWTIEVHVLSAYLPPENGLVEAFVRNSGVGRYGAVLFWRLDPITSRMGFGTDSEGRVREAGGLVGMKKMVRAGSSSLTCWHSSWPRDPGLFSVNCELSSAIAAQSLYAYFTGQEADLPLFYSILSGITKRLSSSACAPPIGGSDTARDGAPRRSARIRQS